MLTRKLKMFLILNIYLKNMLYSICFSFWHYICSGKRENKFLGLTSSPTTIKGTQQIK